MNNSRLLLGLKFIPKDAKRGDIDSIVRCISVKNEKEISVIDKSSDVFKADPDIFMENYTPIDPDGIIAIACVELRDGKDIMNDVIVTYTKSMGHGQYESDPIAVCRQSIADCFYTYTGEDPTKNMVGVSMCRMTCPEQFDFGYMVTCDDVVSGELIRVYLEDTIDDVLAMANTKKPNKVLKELYTEHLEYIKEHPDEKIEYSTTSDSSNGWCSSLEALLNHNKFQYDFDLSNDVIELSIPMKNHLVNSVDDCKDLKAESKVLFEKILHVKMKDPVVVKYDHDIDITSLNTKYLLLRDIYSTVYLLTYIEDGEIREYDYYNSSAKKLSDDELAIYQRLGFISMK